MPRSYTIIEQPYVKDQGFYQENQLKTIMVTQEIGGIATKHCIEIAEVGEERGGVVVSFAGTPIGADDYYPPEREVNRIGARIIGVGRPGYGESTHQHDRRVCDAAEWVQEVTDALGIKKFSVIGRSGGGPHALACAALMPDRVEKAVVLSGTSPLMRDAMGYAEDRSEAKWIRNMSQGNQNAFSAAFQRSPAVLEWITMMRRHLLDNPYAIIESLREDQDKPLPNSDYNTLLSRGNIHRVARAHQAAVRSGVHGWWGDVLAIADPRGWGYKLGKVACPTLVIGHYNDPYTPVWHAERLAKAIGENAMLIRGNLGHFASIELTPLALEWLVAQNTGHEEAAIKAIWQQIC